LIGGCDRIDFEVSDPDLCIENDAVFAAWATLPIGMKLGRDVLIDGLGDDETVENAARLSEVWSTWMPGRYSPVGVQFTGKSLPRNANAGEDLVLYSGGVDSCYNILRRRDAGRRDAFLTIHGVDYKKESFDALMSRTAEFVDAFATRRLMVRSNIRRVYKKNGLFADVTYGFVLAAAAFLMRSNFGSGSISADFTTLQEYIVFPWASNVVTNALFASSDFHIKTDNADVTRAEKLALIASDEVALRSLTFCRDQSVQPDNCGRCYKCARTKAMFLAATGEVPDIFIDPTLDGSSLRAMDLSKRTEIVFAVDLISFAKRRGTAALVPGLIELERRLRQTEKQPYNPPKMIKKIRKLFA